MTPARVAAIAACAAEAPLHLDPQEVRALCEAWQEQRETIGCGEAVLQAYDMTPKGLVEMAGWLSSETNGEPEAREAEIVAALQSTAVAFTAYEGWLHLAVAERNAAKIRAEQDVADRDRLRAALEAVEWVGNGGYCPWCLRWKTEGHAPDCRRQAALGQGGGR